VLVSTLALIAAGVAIRRRDRVRVLAATALLVSVASMSLVFTAKVERYSFAVLPLLFALAACGAADVLGGLHRLAGPSSRNRLVPAVAVALTGTLTVCAVTVSMARSPRDFSLAAARISGTTAAYKHLDYQNAAAYIAAHDRPGDKFITLSPPNIPAYYLDRDPDAIIQTGRNKLLYVIERDGRAVDTIFGAPDILAGKDLDLYLAQHHRVWLVSDLGGYLQSVPPDLREELLQHFRLVYSGAGSTVWLWSV